MFTGLKNFLMRGDIVVVAVGLAVALAFSALIASFTANIINPIVARAQGGHALGLGVQLGNDNNRATFLNFGALISSIIYFFVFMLVVYYVIVVPYRRIQAKRGVTAFGPPPRSRPARTACPATCRPKPASASTAAPTSRRPPRPDRSRPPGVTWRRRSWSPRPW
jgi:large conductance mechanosensitive channel